MVGKCDHIIESGEKLFLDARDSPWVLKIMQLCRPHLSTTSIAWPCGDFFADRQTDGQIRTDHFPLAHAHRVIMTLDQVSYILTWSPGPFPAFQCCMLKSELATIYVDDLYQIASALWTTYLHQIQCYILHAYYMYSLHSLVHVDRSRLAQALYVYM